MAVLIVDDQRDMRESLGLLLEAEGYSHVRFADSGRQALDFLTSTAQQNGAGVDVVLTDLMMPGLNGIEVCQQIKSIPDLRDIPVLVVTGRTDEALLDEAFAAGAHDFIPKPVRAKELWARVRAALNLKREMDQRRADQRELVALAGRLRRLNEHLQRLAIVDELTGIPNRRYFNLLLGKEWDRAARDGTPLSLAVVDIDRFKEYNDRNGHPAGDVCLARVAVTLSRLIRRPGDVVARYGGEEFAVLLANTAADGAVAVAEMLRAGIQALGLEHSGSGHGVVTISAGVATAVPDRRTPPERLLGSADAALYRAKAAGRNRVGVATGAMPTK